MKGHLARVPPRLAPGARTEDDLAKEAKSKGPVGWRALQFLDLAPYRLSSLNIILPERLRQGSKHMPRD